MLNEIASEQQPFANEKSPDRIMRKILAWSRPEIPDWQPEPLKELIQVCWEQYPFNRPRFKDMINNPYVFLMEGADEEEFYDFVFDLVQKDTV
jgi:hypothetical protein